MATVIEKPVSRGGSSGSQNQEVRECMVLDAADRAAAETAILADITMFPITITATIFGSSVTLVRDSVDATPFEDGNDPPTTWEGRVTYVLSGFSNQPYKTGDSSRSFKLGFQQINRKQSLHTWSSYTDDGSDAPDMHGLINVDPESDTVGGVDVDVPTFTWSETHYYADADVTEEWLAGVYAAANAPVFDQDFRGFAAYESKFMGMQGGQRTAGGDWELTFDFAASPNITDGTLGAITGIVKGGWDYLWGMYARTSVTIGSKTHQVMKVKAAYVEKVYHTCDPALLGI